MDVFKEVEILTFNECSWNPIIFVTPRLTSLRKQQHHIENIGSFRSKLGLVVFGYLQWVRRSIDADVWAVRDDSRNRWRPNQEFLDVFYQDAPIVLVEETSSEEESSDDAIDSDSGSEVLAARWTRNRYVRRNVF